MQTASDLEAKIAEEIEEWSEQVKLPKQSPKTEVNDRKYKHV